MEGARLHKRGARGRWGGFPGIEAQPVLARARGELPLAKHQKRSSILIDSFQTGRGWPFGRYFNPTVTEKPPLPCQL